MPYECPLCDECPCCCEQRQEEQVTLECGKCQPRKRHKDDIDWDYVNKGGICLVCGTKINVKETQATEGDDG